MKKIFSFLMMALVIFIPLNVHAETAINYTCTNVVDENGNFNCTINYKIVGESNVTDLTVTLTEQGGATITEISNASSSNWTVTSRDEDTTTNVWTVKLNAPGSPDGDEGDLFKFSYKPSGTKDCRIVIGLGDKTVTVAPPTTPDKPTENKQTGATLPYIALGAIVVLATGAYLATRNKAKMYKI